MSYLIYQPLPIYKVCRECGTETPAVQLVKCKACTLGVDALCKKCRNAALKKSRSINPEPGREACRRYYDRHLESQRERGSLYRAENRQAINRRAQNYYELHRHEILISKKAFRQQYPEKARDQDRRNNASRSDGGRSAKRRQYAKNPQKYCALTRQNRLRYPEVFRVAQERRRTRVRALPDTITTEDWRICLDHWNNACAICGRPEGDGLILALDHWIPLTSPDCPGGVPTNILPLCHSIKAGWFGCNNSKHDRNPVEWLNDKLGERKAQEKLAEIQTYFRWAQERSASNQSGDFS